MILTRSSFLIILFSVAATCRGGDLLNQILEFNRRAGVLNPQEKLQRTRLLYQLIAEDPQQAISVASSALGDLNESREGVVSGEIADDFRSNRSETRWTLRTTGNETLQLYFSASSTLPTCGGQSLQIAGLRVEDRIAVFSWKTLPASANTGTDRAAVSAAECANTKISRRIAVIPVSMPSFPLSARTADIVKVVFFGKSESVDRYLREVSYGVASASGDVLPPVQLGTNYGCGVMGSLLSAVLPLLSNVDLRQYHHLVLVTAHGSYCNPDGSASFGCISMRHNGNDLSAGVVWMSVESETPGFERAVYVASHEIGHNLGLSHANSVEFPGYTFGSLSRGQVREYGDPWSVMGGGYLGHLSGPQKNFLGCLPPADILNVNQPGTYSIRPLESPGPGTRLLRVVRPPGSLPVDSGGGEFYIEYRRNTGFDASIRAMTYDGALIHYEPPGSGDNNANLLRFNPQFGQVDDTLHVGTTWKDPLSMVRVTVDSATAEALTVRISHEDACASIDPPGVYFMTIDAVTESLSVKANGSCSWSAVSDSPWIIVTNSGDIRSGDGTVQYSVPTNYGAKRFGSIRIGSQRYSIMQNGYACDFLSIYEGRTSITAAGITGALFNIQTGNVCPWTTSSPAPWITLSTLSGSGPNYVSYSVAPNPLPTSRTATISVGSAAFPITQSGANGGYTFVPIVPCRLVDTRLVNGPFGGPAIAALETRVFPLRQSSCSIPANASAYAVNLTVVPQSSLSYVTMYPTGVSQPVVSTLNSVDGRIKANAAILPAGTNGAVSVYATDRTDVILDISGYFVPTGGLLFYPVEPCRLVDTRLPDGPLGGPMLPALQTRSFPVLLNTTCGISSAAQAYAVNITAVPKTSLGYLTAWPTGSARPLASTLNAVTGTVTANAAILPAGSGNGAVSVFAIGDTHLVMDITGYFAPPGTGQQQTGFRFYPVTPCRVLDTREPYGPVGGPLLTSSRFFFPSQSTCEAPINAGAFSLNATVVPEMPFGYLTLWGSNGPPPLASILNALDGAVTSNAVILTQSEIVWAYVTDPANLILDINGYFAP